LILQENVVINLPAVDINQNCLYLIFNEFYSALSVGCSIWKTDYLDLKEIEMSKKMIFAMALSLVLVSGSLFSAQANCCFSPCGWYLPSLCGSHCCSKDRDTDKGNLGSADTYQFPYNGVYEPSPWPPGQ
jgi:hypothetical protein